MSVSVITLLLKTLNNVTISMYVVIRVKYAFSYILNPIIEKRNVGGVIFQLIPNAEQKEGKVETYSL